MNGLDRILRDTEAGEPSADFAAEVMEAVHREAATKVVSGRWLLLLGLLFLAFVGLPVLLLTMEGARVLGAGGELSARLLWFVSLVVVTSVAAILPMQLLEG